MCMKKAASLEGAENLVPGLESECRLRMVAAWHAEHVQSITTAVIKCEVPYGAELMQRCYMEAGNWKQLHVGKCRKVQGIFK